MPIRSFLLVLLALAAAAPADAQREPARPGLPRGADTNDWEAYFELGDRLFRHRPAQSGPAFYWAARLDPTRAEPIFAQWAAFYAADPGTWLAWLDENPAILARPQVIRNDSLVTAAFRRNPFVHRGLEVALYARIEEIGRRLAWNEHTTALMDYGKGDFRGAADRFGRIVRSNPGRNARFRHWRAISFVGAGQLDSAAVELQSLIRELEAQDRQRLVRYYESRALAQHALGVVEEARGRPAAAQRAFEAALVEDMAMFPARAALARLALRERRADQAVEHMEQAVLVAPGDAVMQFELGNALLAAGRNPEAAEAFRAAIRMEPHWAEPYLRLGGALDLAGDAAAAAAAYRMYLERAPRRHAEQAARVRARLAELSGGG